MKIYLGADHAGYELKEKIKIFLKTLDHSVEDFGAFELDNSDDYPDFIIAVSKSVEADPESFGIVFGASGQGEAMCANKAEGVRAGVYYGKSGNQKDIDGDTLDIIASMRKHNNVNLLSIGARFVSEDEAEEAIKVFLDTKFSGDERHVRRLSKF